MIQMEMGRALKWIILFLSNLHEIGCLSGAEFSVDSDAGSLAIFLKMDTCKTWNFQFLLYPQESIDYGARAGI